MAVTYVATGTLSETSGTTLNVAYPTLTAGDILLLQVSTGTSATHTIADPSGWTQVLSSFTSGVWVVGIWLKVATGSESGTLAVTTQGASTAVMHSFRGVDNTTPQDVAASTTFQTTGSNSTIVLSSITAATVGAMPVWLGMCNVTGRSYTSTGTEIFDGGTKTCGFAYWDTTVGSTGAIGSRTVTPSTSSRLGGALLLLRPAAGSFTGTASLTGTVTVTTAGALGVGTDASLAPAVTVTVAGQVATSTGASAAPAVTITAAGVVGTVTGATVAPTVTVTAAGTVTPGLSASATRTVAATVTAAGAVATSATATVTVTVDITAAGRVGITATATLNPTATITSTGATGTAGTATQTATVTIAASGVVGMASAAVLAIAASVVSAGTVTIPPPGSMAPGNRPTAGMTAGKRTGATATAGVRATATMTRG